MANASSYKREQVVEIIGSVVQRISAMRHDNAPLLHEIQSLKDAIDNMRKELNAANPDAMQTHIPNATGELDAIVETTENATHEIMGACENIQKILEDKPVETSAAIESEIIRIIEACTFQDLTGQRISKILKSLKDIDACATQVSKILGEHFADFEGGENAEAAPGDGLLNGPQLPGQGISQEEIDKLLEDF